MTDQPETVAAEISETEFSDVVTAVTKLLDEGNPGVRLAGFGLDAGALSDSISAAVKQTLAISIFDMCLKAWHGMKSVRALTGDKGPMDGKPRVAALLKHKLKAKHEPEIHLTIAEAIDLHKVCIPVTLTAEVAGIALTVVNRQITAVSAGHIDVSLSIHVEKVKVVERKLHRFNFSESLQLAPAQTEINTPREEAQQIVGG